MFTPNKRLKAIVAAVPVLLLVPLIAMQFTSEINWDGTDFFVMGILLLSTGLFCELTLRKIKQPQHRQIVVGFILFLAFMIWAELATGYFRSTLTGLSSLKTTLLQPSFLLTS